MDDGKGGLPKRSSLSFSASVGPSSLLMVLGLAVTFVSVLLSMAEGVGPDGNYPSWRMAPLLGAGEAVFVIGAVGLLVQLGLRRRARLRSWVTGVTVAACVVLLVVASVQVRLRSQLSQSLLSALRALTPPAGVTVVQAPYLMNPDQPPGPDDGFPQNAYATWRSRGGDACADLTAALGGRPGWHQDESGSCGWRRVAGRIRLLAYLADPAEGAAPGTINLVAEAND